jgi:hypothetical protein
MRRVTTATPLFAHDEQAVRGEPREWLYWTPDQNPRQSAQKGRNPKNAEIGRFRAFLESRQIGPLIIQFSPKAALREGLDMEPNPSGSEL